MTQLQNQREINAVNGNVMAWLADKQIDEEYKDGIDLLRERCVDCGVQEFKMRQYNGNLNGYVLRSNLTDGLCEECLWKPEHSGDQRGN